MEGKEKTEKSSLGIEKERLDAELKASMDPAEFAKVGHTVLFEGGRYEVFMKDGSACFREPQKETLLVPAEIYEDAMDIADDIGGITIKKS